MQKSYPISCLCKNLCSTRLLWTCQYNFTLVWTSIIRIYSLSFCSSSFSCSILIKFRTNNFIYFTNLVDEKPIGQLNLNGNSFHTYKMIHNNFKILYIREVFFWKILLKGQYNINKKFSMHIYFFAFKNFVFDLY